MQKRGARDNRAMCVCMTSKRAIELWCARRELHLEAFRKKFIRIRARRARHFYISAFFSIYRSVYLLACHSYMHYFSFSLSCSFLFLAYTNTRKHTHTYLPFPGTHSCHHRHLYITQHISLPIGRSGVVKEYEQANI